MAGPAAAYVPSSSYIYLYVYVASVYYDSVCIAIARSTYVAGYARTGSTCIHLATTTMIHYTSYTTTEATASVCAMLLAHHVASYVALLLSS